MGNEIAAERHVNRAIGDALVGGASIAEEELAADGATRLRPRNTGIDDVHHAANRRRSEQQCRWSAQHLDPLRRQGVDRDGVIGTRRGKVEAADAVRENADAVTGQSAENWCRSCRTKTGGANARLAGECLANAGPDLASEVGCIEYRNAPKHIGRAATDAGDDDFIALRVMPVLCVLRLRRRRIGWRRCFLSKGRSGRSQGE